MIKLLYKEAKNVFRYSTSSSEPGQPRIIKAKKIVNLTKQSINIQQILKTLKLNPISFHPQKDDYNYQLSKHFLNQSFRNLNRQNYKDTLKQLEQHNLFQYFFKCLSEKSKFGRQQQQFLQILLTNILKLYLISNPRQVNQEKLTQNILLLNQYLMLIQLNFQLISLFLKFSIKYQYFLKKMDKQALKFINDKFIFNQILYSTKFKFNFRFIRLAMAYCSSYSMQLRYYQKNQQIMTFLIKRFPSDWALLMIQQENQNKNEFQKFLKSLLHIKFFNKNLLDGIKFVVKQNFKKFKTFQIILAIKILIQLRQIRCDNISDFLPLIKIIIAKSDDLFFQYCNTELFRAAIWDKQIWISFFQWLRKSSSFQKIPVYFLYSIYYLLSLDKQLICQEIIAQQNITRAYLLQKHNLRYDNINKNLQYTRLMHNKPLNNMSVQQSLTNNMRLISQLQIKSEVEIALFNVDIVIGDKTVIQINNKDHYIHNIDQKTVIYNLKSQFRKRVLQKLGYKYLDIDVSQVKQGSFQLLKELTQKGILKQSKSIY